MIGSSRRGLTLIEILLAVVILVMVLGSAYVVLFSTIETRAHLESALAADRIGTRIVSVIASDLRAIHPYRVKDSALMAEASEGRVEQTTSVQFLTTTRSILPAGERYSPVNEVGYLLEANPDRPGFHRLYRREDFFVDDKPLEGGKRVLLHDAVEQFRLGFYDEKSKKYVSKWPIDGQGAKEEDKKQGGLPTRVEILLVLATPPSGIGDESAPPSASDEALYRFKAVLEIPSRERDEEKTDDEGGKSPGSGPEVLDEDDVEPK